MAGNEDDFFFVVAHSVIKLPICLQAYESMLQSTEVYGFIMFHVVLSDIFSLKWAKIEEITVVFKQMRRWIL